MKDEIKSQLKEKYDAVKALYKSGSNIVANIKESNLDAEYLSTLSKLDDEYSNYQNGSGNYVVGTPEIKKQQLSKQLAIIRNNFYKAVYHLDTKNLVTIEAEIEGNKAQQIHEYIALLESGAVMAIEDDINLNPWCPIL
jgi:hypothetical protein